MLRFHNNTRFIYWGFVGLFCIGIVSYSRYGFNLDDIWMWLKIYQGEMIIDGFRPHSGRFYPLAFLDLNIGMHFIKTPYFYFALNALCVVIVAYMLYRMIDFATSFRGGGKIS